MIPTAFDEENMVLNKPNAMTANQCEALSVYRGQYVDGTPVVISCWKMTAEEMEEVKRTGRIWLTVMGATMPPAHLSGVHPFKTGG